VSPAAVYNGALLKALAASRAPLAETEEHVAIKMSIRIADKHFNDLMI